MSCLKKYITLFFIPVVLVSAINFPLVYLEFEINKDYIRDVLCVNRDKPITVCGGSCYLKKRLTQEQSEKTDATSKTKRVALGLYFEEILEIFIAIGSHEALHKVFQQIYSYSYTKGIFHPPCTYLG